MTRTHDRDDTRGATRMPELGPRIVVHYGELGTKLGNRRMFEKALQGRLAEALRGTGWNHPKLRHGRLELLHEPAGDTPDATAAGSTDGGTPAGPDATLDDALDRLTRVPGVAWFARAVGVEHDLDAVCAEAVRQAAAIPGAGPFAVRARRSWKEFPHDSTAIGRVVGAAVEEATKRPVDLDAPDLEVHVHVTERGVLVFTDRREGCGGLPVGVSGTLVALLSGGIDSPVACVRMMRRGCRIVPVHFFNDQAGGAGVREKVLELVESLAAFHGVVRLRLIPFAAVQRELIAFVPPPLRMIAYRRLMFRIAARVRDEVGAGGYVTGDSVGQVASQTLDNLQVIWGAADAPVYAPLAGMDKVEIVDEARAAGTYETSIQPGDDCCSFLVPEHPETRARIADVEEAEAPLDMHDLVERALAGAEEIAVHPRLRPRPA